MIDFLNASVAYEITKKNKEKLSTVPPEVYKKNRRYNLQGRGKR